MRKDKSLDNPHMPPNKRLQPTRSAALRKRLTPAGGRWMGNKFLNFVN